MFDDLEVESPIELSLHFHLIRGTKSEIHEIFIDVNIDSIEVHAYKYIFARCFKKKIREIFELIKNNAAEIEDDPNKLSEITDEYEEGDWEFEFNVYIDENAKMCTLCLTVTGAILEDLSQQDVIDQILEKVAFSSL